MSDITKTPDSEMIPAKELWRKQQKAEYEKAKAARKADRVAEKSAKREAKLSDRAARDEAIFGALKKASEIDT